MLVNETPLLTCISFASITGTNILQNLLFCVLQNVNLWSLSAKIIIIQ